VFSGQRVGHIWSRELNSFFSPATLCGTKRHSCPAPFYQHKSATNRTYPRRPATPSPDNHSANGSLRIVTTLVLGGRSMGFSPCHYPRNQAVRWLECFVYVLPAGLRFRSEVQISESPGRSPGSGAPPKFIFRPQGPVSRRMLLSRRAASPPFAAVMAHRSMPRPTMKLANGKPQRNLGHRPLDAGQRSQSCS
jgi:hypothetical protein